MDSRLWDGGVLERYCWWTEVHAMSKGFGKAGGQQRVVTFWLVLLLVAMICMAYILCVGRCEEPVKVVVCKWIRHGE